MFFFFFVIFEGAKVSVKSLSHTNYQILWSKIATIINKFPVTIYW